MGDLIIVIYHRAIDAETQVIPGDLLGDCRAVEKAEHQITDGIAGPVAVSRHGPSRVVEVRLIKPDSRIVDTPLQNVFAFDPGELAAQLDIRHEVLDRLVIGIPERKEVRYVDKGKPLELWISGRSLHP